MNTGRFFIGSALAACLGALALSAGAEGPPPPPPEAFAACDGKGEGDTCSVQFQSRELRGTCKKEPDGTRLFCLPNDLPPPPAPPGSR